MKSNLRKARFKANKSSSCTMCKPYKNGWEDKKNMQQIKQAVSHDFQLKEAGL